MLSINWVGCKSCYLMATLSLSLKSWHDNCLEFNVTYFERSLWGQNDTIKLDEMIWMIVVLYSFLITLNEWSQYVRVRACMHGIVCACVRGASWDPSDRISGHLLPPTTPTVCFSGGWGESGIPCHLEVIWAAHSPRSLTSLLPWWSFCASYNLATAWCGIAGICLM